MPPRRLSTLAVAAAAGLVTGCAAQLAAERYASDVLSTITAVKATGNRQLLGSRAVRLPKPSLEPIAMYELRYPAACGGHAFRVYETGDTQILEYDYELPGGTMLAIRDYVAGPGPFIRPGLWTSYDHTSTGIREMTPDFVETSAVPLFPPYSRGLKTGLGEMTRDELDVAYREAIRGAVLCAAG